MMRRTKQALLGSVCALCVSCSSETPPGSAQAGAGGSAQAGAGGDTTGGGFSAGGGGQAGSSGGASGSQAAAGAGGSSAQTSGAGGSSGDGGSGGGGGSGGSAGGGGAALEPCSEPSVSRLKVWETQVVGGTQTPANGSPLRAFEGGHELYISWTLDGGGSYGTANAPLENRGEYTNGANPAQHAVDISDAGGVTLEYATTGNAYMQIRTATTPHGGDHFRADIPTSGGQLRTVTLDFASFRRPGGTTPPGEDILSDAFSFTFVAAGTTTLTLRQVLIPGYVPPCD